MFEHVNLTAQQIREAQVMSHELWSGGIDLDERIERLQGMRVGYPDAMRYVGLVEGGETVASMKLYRCYLWVESRLVQCIGLGAIFTREDRRGCGFASRLINSVLSEADASGLEGALLWSDIGKDYYERFGFRPFSLRKNYYAFSSGASESTVSYRRAVAQDFSFQFDVYNNAIKPLSIATTRSADLWPFYRELNRAADYIVERGNGERVGYFSAAKEQDLLWVDEAVPLVGSEGEVWSAVCKLASAEGAQAVYSWNDPFGVLPEPVKSEDVVKPIPMVRLLNGEELTQAKYSFASLDHF